MGSDSTKCWDLFSIYNFLKFWLKSTAFAENLKFSLILQFYLFFGRMKFIKNFLLPLPIFCIN